MGYVDKYTFTLYHRNADASNLIDPFKMVQGIIVNADGTLTSSANYAATNFIPVSGGATYEGFSDSLSSGGRIFFKVAEYDTNKQLLSGTGFTNVDTFTTNGATAFVRLTLRSIAFGSDQKSHGLLPIINEGFVPYYTSRVLRPIYDDLERTLRYEKEQFFKVERLNGDFVLGDLDYDYVFGLLDTDLETKFYVEITDDLAVMPALLQEFYLTDLEYNVDDRLITVKSKTANPADEIMRAYRKKVDLSEAIVPLSEVTVTEKSVVQMYIRGAETVTNIRGSEVWYEPVTYYAGKVVNRTVLTTTHSFARIWDELKIAAGYVGSLSTNVTGTYINMGTISGQPYYENGTYRIAVNAIANRWEVTTIAGGTVLYTSPVYVVGIGLTPLEDALYLRFSGFGGQTGNFYIDVMDVYMRVLTSKEVITATGSSSPTTVNTAFRNANDITSFRGEYGLVAPITAGYISNSPASSFLSFSETTTPYQASVSRNYGTVPTPYLNAGEYYDGILQVAGTLRQGVCPSFWRNTQVYMAFDINNDLLPFELTNARPVLFRNAINIADLIKVMLTTFDIEIDHEEDTLFSEFLYGAFPGGTFGAQKYYDIPNTTTAFTSATPRQNTRKFILDKKAYLEYNTSVLRNKLELSLEDVFTILDTIYRVKWHVDGRKLILEQAYWYLRGGSYTTDQLAIDTTLIENPLSGKSWSFRQNKFTFNKIEIPERIDPRFTEKTSDIFDYFPIDLNNGFVDEENVREVQLQLMTNIDFLNYNRRNTDDTGFIMVEAVEDELEAGAGAIWYVAWAPYNELTTALIETYVQNGWLSFHHLINKYYIYDLPTDNATAGSDTLDTTNNITRKKEQDIVFPYIADLSTFGLVRTDLGDGELSEAKISMSSRIVEAKIKHDIDL